MLLDNLRSDLEKASRIDTGSVSGLIRDRGFSCDRCGWCCCPDPDFGMDIGGIRRPSNAISVFPEDVRGIMKATGLTWLDVVEPDLYSGIRGEQTWAIGWILKRNARRNCTFFDGESRSCSIYEHRPLICRCYPFFLDGDTLVVRHCRAARREVDQDEVDVLGNNLVAYLLTRTRNYIAIAEWMGKLLDMKRLCKINPEEGLVLQVFDGETISRKCY